MTKDGGQWLGRHNAHTIPRYPRVEHRHGPNRWLLSCRRLEKRGVSPGQINLRVRGFPGSELINHRRYRRVPRIDPVSLGSLHFSTQV